VEQAMIVDCHVHLNNYHDDTNDSLAECVARLKHEMRRNRVDLAVVLTSYKVTPGRPSTGAVVNALRDGVDACARRGTAELQHV
jgi:hypothetical protein